MSDAVTPTKQISVLISYAKQDEAIADFVQNVLNEAGYHASTFTAGVLAGDRWISSINLSLETADVVVLLLSKAALESPWVLYESSASIASVEKSSNKRIIPVALDKDLAPSGVLSQYQWITTSGDPREVADSVIRALVGSRTLDKAFERSETLRNLENVEYILKFETATWEAQRKQRNDRALMLLALISTFAILAVAIAAIILTKPNPNVLASIGAIGSIVFGGLGYVVGRLSFHHERGASNDRPRN